MRKNVAKILMMVLMVAVIAALTACTFSSNTQNPYEKVDNPGAMGNYEKEATIQRTTSAINKLKAHLQSDTVTDTGYFIEFDADFDSDKTDESVNGSHFTLKFKANLYTHPYLILDENGDPILDEEGRPLVDEKEEAIHNEVIKKNDLIIEWYDGHTNKLLVGLYFDGKNSSAANPGNNLYINLRGETKRMFRNFGDTVMYRQLVRLITSIDIEKLLGGNENIDDTLGALGYYLNLAVTNNYKVTTNDATTSIFYNQLNFDLIASDITDIIVQIFGPFGNKIDPLTDYYLGFKFSTVGGAEIKSLTSDLRFLCEYVGSEEILTGFELDAVGTALVKNKTVPFRTNAKFNYASGIKSDIRVAEFIEIAEYNEYLYGQYEYEGELYVPMMEQQNMESRMDAVVRTKLTSDVEKNDENRIQMDFTDKANGSRLLLGAYYCNERTYLNTTGLQNLYGGIKINEIGFPRAYIDGPNIAALLSELYDTINDIVTDYVDGIVIGNADSGVLFNEILAKMSSGDETISIRIDLELIKVILRETEEGHPEYTTQQLIDLLSDAMGYDLEEIAFMLGIPDAKRMLEKSWFDLTYNVVTNAVRVELSTKAFNESVESLIFRLDLYPNKIGEAVTFPTGFDTWFDDYKELQDVKTISASMSGTIKFANGAAVDISDLLGAMIGDKSGLNTKFFLPASSSLGFSLVFDQYVKFDDYGDDVYPGDGWEDQIGQMRGRVGLKLSVWEELSAGSKRPLLNVYAKDVAFNTDTEEADLGYVWVDIPATGFTKVKIREDVFLASLNDYMGGNSAAEEAMALSIPQIVGALFEDSNSIDFLPDVIQISTSNKTIQKLFGVKAVHMKADIDVGLTPRVTGITQLENEFADYTVGELQDMTGDDGSSAGVYEKNLYDTIAVTFTLNGSAWIEYLRVPYYRVSAPGAVTDYDSQEDYDAAVARYEEYKKSMHSLEVVDGKSMYYPSTDGNFMGQFRSYTVEIRKPGGASLTSVTSKILELAETDLIWEPLEAQPTTILGVIKNGQVSVPASFGIDWNSVTLDGIEKTLYTVTIGPGSIGEAAFQTFITVRNRRITQENGGQSESATVYTEIGSPKTVPVAAELSIDPYDYIIWRGEYVQTNGEAPQNPIGQYLMSRTDLKSVIFRFGDGQSERVTLTWSFDAEGADGLNGERYITAEGGNTLYAHAYFHNQLIALKIKVLRKEFDYVMFDGESERNVYTVDVLNTLSKTIPVRPTVYFKDGTSRKFQFDFLWQFAVADNVTLNGAEMVDGVESPFAGHVGNQNAAWLSVASHYGAAAEWFRDVLVTITVEAPAKVIGNVYETEVGGETFYARDVMLDQGEIKGYWIVDPLKAQSKYLPASLTAWFRTADGSRAERHYGADVVRFDDNGNAILSAKTDGKYTVAEPGSPDKTKVRTYVVTGWISEEFSFDLIVVVLPDFDSDSNSLAFFDRDGREIDINEISKDTTDKTVYNYTLNPFESLFLPSEFEIRSQMSDKILFLKEAGADIPLPYYFRYRVTPERRAGNGQNLDYQYVLRGDYTFVNYLRLKPTHTAADISKLVLGDGMTEISAREIADGYHFEKFKLDKEGYVLDDDGQRITVGGGDVKLSDYIRYLFTGVKATVNRMEISVNPTILDFDKFDVQNTLSGDGAKFFVALSEIANYMNIEIVVTAEGLDTISGGNTPTLSITPFTADGKEIYPDGYQLYSQDFTVHYSGAGDVTFRSSRWTVAQVTNLKGNLLPTGTEISVVSAEILRAERENASEEAVILLYAFLPDSSRVNLTVRIAPLDVTTFVSAENELFPIKVVKDGNGRGYSVIEVDNLYAMRQYLVDADTLLSYLPTTVKIGGTELRNVKWTEDAGLRENLSQLQYSNRSNIMGITEFVLSHAEVALGTGTNPYTVTLDLSIRFLPAVLDSIVPDGVFDGSEGVYFERLNTATKTITFRVKPYETPNGAVSFRFPTNYTAKFLGESAAYSLPFRVLYDGAGFTDALYYDYNGTTFRNFIVGDDKNKMTFVLDAGFGQQIRVMVEFIDQTIRTVSGGTSDVWFGTVDRDGVYTLDTLDQSADRVSSNFVVDPYGKKYRMPDGTNVFIPTSVKVNYAAAGENPYAAANLNVLWSNYTVRYGGQSKSALTGIVAREGFTQQTVRIDYSVMNRATGQENVLFANSETADVVISMREAGIPTAHIKNPFTFRVKNDLPSTVKSVAFADGSKLENIPIYWEANDTDVDYGGNNMSAKAVRYRLYDENGQEFTFYFQIDKWEYVGLEREVAGVWQEMNPIYFQISSVSGESDVTAFRVQFRVTDFTGQEGTYNRSEVFYSETSAEVREQGLEPVLYFDAEAIAMATANGNEVQGVFSLGAEGKLKYEVQKSMATAMYSSAKPSVSATYFYYNVLATDYYTPFVLIDPLNPIWPSELYAYVNWTKDRVKLSIASDNNPFGLDVLKYVNRGGGVVIGWTVYVVYHDEKTGQDLRFKQRIDILFLDRSVSKPVATVAVGENPPTEAAVAFQNNYTRNTYDKRVNPYSDSYERAIEYLNVALRVYGAAADATDIVWDKATRTSISMKIDGKTIGSAEYPCSILRYEVI